MSYPYPGHPQDPGGQFYIKLTRHTGAFILFVHQRVAVTGSLQDCESAYRSAQTYNLLLGWWSPFSLLLMNWIALFSNMNAIRKVRAMARAGAGGHVQPAVAPTAPQSGPQASTPPGWYPDSSGPGQRYWDGVGWTEWTKPPGRN